MLQGVYVFIIFVCKRNVIFTIIGKKSRTRTQKNKSPSGTSNGVGGIPLIPINNKNRHSFNNRRSLTEATHYSEVTALNSH